MLNTTKNYRHQEQEDTASSVWVHLWVQLCLSPPDNSRVFRTLCIVTVISFVFILYRLQYWKHHVDQLKYSKCSFFSAFDQCFDR